MKCTLASKSIPNPLGTVGDQNTHSTSRKNFKSLRRLGESILHPFQCERACPRAVGRVKMAVRVRRHLLQGARSL